MALNIDEFVQKYNPHPETVNYMRIAAASGAKPYYEIGVEASRQFSIERNENLAGKIEFDGSEKEIIVPSPDVKEGIPVSVYKPKSCDSLQAPSILVYFHGGGNVLGCRKTHETVCKILARDTPCIVANVEYRLAPEHKFPANNDDAKCVVNWVAKNKTSIGGSSESKLGVAGDSAGGRLAAVVSHEAYQVIDFAVLIYPNVNYNLPYPSATEFQNGPVLAKKITTWFMSNYLKTEGDKSSPRASVIKQKEFSYLPPTLIIVAELDALRDGCYAYHDVLKAAGVDVSMKIIKGVPHAFWGWPAMFPTTCKEAHTAAIDFIKKQAS